MKPVHFFVPVLESTTQSQSKISIESLYIMFRKKILRINIDHVHMEMRHGIFYIL